MKSRTVRNVIRIILIIAAAGFILLGVLRKEPAEVRGKGSLICLECTGLG